MSVSRPASVVDAAGFAAAGVTAFTTTRGIPGRSRPPFDRFNLGKRCGDEPVAVEANREALVEAFRLPSAPRWLRQVHGSRVVRCERNDARQAEPEADAAITSEPGLALAVLTADCLPLFLTAVDGSEIALVHAGWRGLAAGVVEATLAAMRTPPASLRAWMGPAIGPAAYQVGDDVRKALGNGGDSDEAFAAEGDGHWRCDLYAIARRRLAAAGVRDIGGGGLCTHSDPTRFYSHRRDGATGRMASVIWIAPRPRD